MTQSPIPPDDHLRDTRQWLIAFLARSSGVIPDEVDPDGSFESYGVDSTTAWTLSGELSERLGIELDAEALYRHPSVNRLCAHLESCSSKSGQS